jgi:hypothetical protein
MKNESTAGFSKVPEPPKASLEKDLLRVTRALLRRRTFGRRLTQLRSLQFALNPS